MTQRRLARGDFLGALRKSVSGGGFCVELRIATLPPEAVVEHAHDEAHFILPFDEGYRSLAGQDGRGGPIRAGGLIYNPPGTTHQDCFDEAGGRFLSVSIPVTSEIGGDLPVLLDDVVSTAAVRRLVGGCIRFAPGDELALEDHALAMVAVAARRSSARRGAPPDWLETARVMIADLAGNQGLEVRGIAAAVGVHPVHLARAFRQCFGISPGDAIRRRRADIAMAALARGLRPVEAANAAGYADQSHMTREHGRIYGVSPMTSAAALA
ncbi:helix-turn-helix domain-containing protein [uncultured Brevundimonas sp.]|uniref:AraC family transcriptional regulator n=1 Tax=uncultured Brevundimonas sp. TaxID=213418 RepID=UPI0030ED8110|tara:strand:+ start:144045 stop:144848 length:804 start_codon:yes stop_codon:yes gene_type:complete